MERIARNPKPAVWLVIASSGEYMVEGETAGHAIITFMASKTDDFVHAVCAIEAGWELREKDPHDQSYGSETLSFDAALALLVNNLGYDETFATWAIRAAREKGNHRISPDHAGYRVQIDHAGDGRFTVTVHSRKN